jgi:hypothetical protein
MGSSPFMERELRKLAPRAKAVTREEAATPAPVSRCLRKVAGDYTHGNRTHA